MTEEIINANITFVSLVDKAANGKKFAIIKSEAKPVFQKEVPIIKADDEKHLVTGLVYEPDVEDTQGQYMTAGEIEKAAHKFMMDYQAIDLQHNFQANDYGVPVESYIAKSDHLVGTELIKAGSWVMTVFVKDETVWDSIKKGDITGFSMGGTGEIIQKAKTKEVDKTVNDETQIQKFFNVMKNFFSPIEKGELLDSYKGKKKVYDVWDAMGIFQDYIIKYNWIEDKWEAETDEAKVREAISDLVTILSNALLSDNIIKSLGKPKDEVLKAGKKISASNMSYIDSAIEALTNLKNDVEGEEEEVKKEDIQALVEKALEPVSQKLNELEGKVQKSDEPVEELKDEITKEALSEIINKALEPLNARLETVEKSRGIQKSAEDDENLQKSNKSLWDGVL